MKLLLVDGECSLRNEDNCNCSRDISRSSSLYSSHWNGVEKRRLREKEGLLAIETSCIVSYSPLIAVVAPARRFLRSCRRSVAKCVIQCSAPKNDGRERHRVAP